MYRTKEMNKIKNWKQICRGLTDRNMDIFCYRYGLSKPYRSHTYAECGLKFSLSRDRTQQIAEMVRFKLNCYTKINYI